MGVIRGVARDADVLLNHREKCRNERAHCVQLSGLIIVVLHISYLLSELP
jgi:hypothetical protein